MRKSAGGSLEARTDTRGESREGGMRNREAGKTGVELAIVLMIIGIVAVFIIPQVADVLEVNRGKGAAEQVASLMRLARQYAISTGVQYDVRLTGTTVRVA